MKSPQPLEFALGSGGSVFGELWLPESPRGSVLLLHERGSDLDSLRAFAEPLRVLDLASVLIDMPGDGLSDGTWETDGPVALRLGLAECSRHSTSVGAIAIGSAGNLLFGMHPAPVVVAALVSPRLSPDELSAAELWRGVPQIWIGDPCDTVIDQSMENLSKWIHAWSLRMFVHYLDGDAPQAGAWTPNMTQSAAAFIAEQIAYRNAGGRGRSVDDPSDLGTVSGGE